MRGGSELVDKSGEEGRSGLDLEYATSWSYGIEETPNLFIPNFNGGASAGELGRNSQTYKTLRENGYAAEQIVKALPLYWGPQPFTAGPMYMGAISMFLFILGFFVLKGGLRWWIGGVSLLALMLSWGYHLMPVSEFFFKFAPLYNKFRAVSMILVILQILIPVMAVLLLNEVLFGQQGYQDKNCRERVKKGFIWALGIVGGFCLVFALIPSLAGSFYANGDAQLPEVMLESLWADRASLLRADALRSLIFIVVAALVLWLGFMRKLKGPQAAMILALLVLVDMWSIGKRYLNESHFVSHREFNNVFTPRPVDNIILADTDPNYRVLDLSVNTFNDSYVSYHHKTIGGYSPVKLQRYQDLIEHHISKEMGEIAKDLQGVQTIEQALAALGNYDVLNMLNTKYIVINGNAAPLLNQGALGNAWFVNSIVKAANANEEIELLGNINPGLEAVVAENYMKPEYLGEFYTPATNSRGKSYFFESDTTASIELVSYSPNKLVYKYRSSTPNIALFSEVFYAPGWSAELLPANGQAAAASGEESGKELEIFRANYILRGLALPAGEGEIVFEFAPDSIIKGETFSRIASALIILLFAGACAVTFINRKKQSKKQEVASYEQNLQII